MKKILLLALPVASASLLIYFFFFVGGRETISRPPVFFPKGVWLACENVRLLKVGLAKQGVAAEAQQIFVDANFCVTAEKLRIDATAQKDKQMKNILDRAIFNFQSQSMEADGVQTCIEGF